MRRLRRQAQPRQRRQRRHANEPVENAAIREIGLFSDVLGSFLPILNKISASCGFGSPRGFFNAKSKSIRFRRREKNENDPISKSDRFGPERIYGNEEKTESGRFGGGGRTYIDAEGTGTIYTHTHARISHARFQKIDFSLIRALCMAPAHTETARTHVHSLRRRTFMRMASAAACVGAK